MSTTSYMSLSLPTVGSTAGPAWATQINAALSLVDSHDHSPGKGVPVRSSGLYVDSGLSFGGFDATGLRSVRFTNHASPLAVATDLGCLFVSAGELYYRDASGNALQLTAGGALNTASLGAIGGDYSTAGASLFYTSASKLFSFESSAGVKAHAAVGNLLITEAVASGKAATIRVPTGLAANYQLTLPAALPAATKIATIDNTGAIAATYDVDGVTLEVASNLLRVKPGATLSLGALTLSSGATITGGASISTGNITLPAAASQSITKSGGELRIGTSDANETGFLYNGSVAASFNASGLYMATGKKVQNLGTPTADGDAATKAYVDSGSTATAAVTGVHANLASGPAVYKSAGRVWFDNAFPALTGTITGSSSALTDGNTLFTIPAGYRPATHAYLFVLKRTAVGPTWVTCVLRIDYLSGAVTIHDPAGGTFIVNDQLFFASIPPWTAA